MSLGVDSGGWPVFLAVPPSTTAPTVETKVTTSTPTSVDPLEWARRQDAVREAAREFEPLSSQDLQERLRGATSRPLTADEVSTFEQDVRSQVLDDLVDALDQNQRGRRRSRRTVRVVAPRGYVKKTMRSLSAAERSDLEARLRARGWTDLDVHSVFGDKTQTGLTTGA